MRRAFRITEYPKENGTAKLMEGEELYMDEERDSERVKRGLKRAEIQEKASRKEKI